MAETRQRKISTYYSEIYDGYYAEVWMDFKEEVAFVKYFSYNHNKFYEEEFPNYTVAQVEVEAENWTLGHNKLDGRRGIQFALL